MEEPQVTELIQRVGRWTGLWIGGDQRALLGRFHDWLADEAVKAGGIGPREVPDLWTRHIADSLLLARCWRNRRVDGILDIGTGVGLPAIPLAITMPETRVVAVDRSLKRVRLARRAARVLGLENVIVIAEELVRWVEPAPVVVSRAAIPAAELRAHLVRLVMPGGVGCIGGSHMAPPVVPGYETIEVPAEVLDRAAWILKMAPFEEEA